MKYKSNFRKGIDMKRIIAFIIAAIMVFAFCACGQTASEEFSLDFNAGMDDSKTNFDGYECVIMQNHMAETADTSLFSYPSGTLLEDLLLQRIKDIENEYNCKVKVKTDGTVRIDSIVPVLASGSYVADILFTSGPSTFIRAGFMYPLDVLSDYIDYTNTDKYGGLGLLEQGLYNSTPYCVTPAMWPGKQTTTSFGVFAVNENLITRYGLTDPRDIVESGEWTWETFERIIPDYQIDDGSVQATACNMTWSIMDFAMMNGADYYTITTDGTVLPALDSEYIAEAIDWCSRLFTEHKDCITFLDHGGMLDLFLNDGIVMTKTAVDHIIRFMSYKMDNFGVVPMPCGPHGTYGKWVNAYNENIAFSILYNTNEPVCSAVVIDELCEPFRGYETEEDLKAYMRSIFFDDRDIDFIMNYFENARWNYWGHASLETFFNNAKTAAISGKSATEFLSANAERINNLVVENIVPNVDFLESFKNNSK